VSPELIVAVVGAILNGAVTWGVMSTKLAWLRRDVDELRGIVFKLQEATA
jgi:hypothetical protein